MCSRSVTKNHDNDLYAEMRKSREIPRILAQPPVIYFGDIILGILLNRFFHSDVLPRNVGLIAGIPIILLSICLSALTFREFIKSKVSVDHKKPTNMIITTGPFRFSRNPLYLSGVVLVFGVGLVFNNLWIIGLLIPSIVLVRYGAILPEERYLLEKFGEEYIKYRSSVRRWV